MTAPGASSPAGFSSGDRWLTVAELAEVLGVDRGYVYRHWRELGGSKLGEGPKAPVRFAPEAVLEATSRLSGRESGAADSVAASGIRARRQVRESERVPEWEPIRVGLRG